MEKTAAAAVFSRPDGAAEKAIIEIDIYLKAIMIA